MTTRRTRRANLKPRQMASRDGAWIVNVPADLSETHVRRQLTFKTKMEATTYCETLRARRDNFGSDLNGLPPVVLAECAEAVKLLPDGFSILAAVRDWRAGYDRRNASVTLEELFEQCIRSKEGSHPKYVADMNQVLRKFEALRNTKVSDIQTVDIESALDGVTNGAKNNALKVARTVLNFGIDRGYLTTNPVRKSSFAKRPKHDREIIPPAKVAVIFEHALANSPEILPYLVVTFFAGVRPEDEAMELTWTDLHDGIVTIHGKVSKTEILREIPLSENAQAWLQAYINLAGSTDGNIVSLTTNQLESRRKAAYKAAGYNKVPQDAARHSFACYWLPANKEDMNGLLSRMGHSDISTLRTHYLRHASKEDAKAFWSIQPPAEAGNIVSFAA